MIEKNIISAVGFKATNRHTMFTEEWASGSMIITRKFGQSVLYLVDSSNRENNGYYHVRNLSTPECTVLVGPHPNEYSAAKMGFREKFAL